LRLQDSAVSRSHAKLRVVDGRAKISDLGSHNGTLINGERITGERSLISGDIISICSINLAFQARVRPSLKRTVLGYPQLRQRAEEELERALRYARPLAMLTVVFGGVVDRPRLAASIFESLRVIDVIGWSASGDHLL